MNAAPPNDLPNRRAVAFTSLGLLALWGLSWGLSFVELGSWSLVVALVIAAAKASLVVLIFMELLHVRASIRLVAASSVAMLALIVILVVADVYARDLR